MSQKEIFGSSELRNKVLLQSPNFKLENTNLMRKRAGGNENFMHDKFC